MGFSFKTEREIYSKNFTYMYIYILLLLLLFMIIIHEDCFKTIIMNNNNDI